MNVRRVLRGAPLLLCLAWLTGGTGACSGKPEVARGGAVQIGDGDRSENALVRVDEALLAGTVIDGELVVDVPVTAIAASAVSGSLNLKLMSVDGSEIHAEVALPYALDVGESATLSGSVPLPDDIVEQPDQVQLNVRVDDGAEHGLRVTKSLLYVVPLYELLLEGPARARQSRPANYRVLARRADNAEPLEDVEVELDLLRDGEVQASRSGLTGKGGEAVFSFDLNAAGEFRLAARTRAYGTAVGLEDALSVQEDGAALLLTTDKPLYQPGQVIHLRALALERGTNRPLADAPVTFEVLDGKGNKVFKKALETDEFGIAATGFQLGNIVNQGTFKVRLLEGERVTEKTVEVSRYALPKFGVDVTTEAPWYGPGDTVGGSVDARYFFGKEVAAGDVLVEAATIDVGEHVFQQVMGKLDASGHFEFELTLPQTLVGLPLQQGNAAVLLRVTVTDSAGQSVVKSSLLTVSESGATIVLVPEATEVVPGVENAFWLFLSDPLGSPLANADVTITTSDGRMLSATSDEHGQAELVFTPGEGTQTFTASIETSGGERIEQTFSFNAQSGADHVVLRTDKAVYETGEVVKVDILTSTDESNVYVDWLNDGQAIDMRTLETENGRSSFTVTADTAHAGSNRIEAYIVDADGNLVRTGRSIFVRSDSALKIELEQDQPVYAPGEEAKLTFSVSDESGAPKVAALGVQIVDQAVFALVDAQPGLLRTYFELEDEFAEPQYQIAGPRANFSNLLFSETASPDTQSSRAAQRRAAGAFAALGNRRMLGIQKGSLGPALARANQLLKPSFDATRDTLTPALRTAVQSLLAALARQGCTTWGQFCASLGETFDAALSSAIEDKITVYDFWGNAYRTAVIGYSNQVSFTSRGPDEIEGTQDDVGFAVSFQLRGDQSTVDSGANAGTGGTFAAPGGVGTGGTATLAPDDGEGDEGSAPRVRQDFPETLYVNPLVITGPDGKASIDVPLADSITEWRISTLASSSDGRLGGAEHGMIVFQDFFIDVNFPATLTRGDEVTFPIAVYNYLDEPQTVQIELAPASWYTPLGGTATSIDLEPGEVAGVSFPVRVEEVGLQSLTVQGLGSSKSDAVARTVRVLPDGKAFALAQSGRLEPGETVHTVDFPATAVPGSAELFVDVFPAFVSQVVQGMDSMLQVPGGCFEQTTSTAWPNVLVTEYMIETDQITPEIQLKAESLMSAGYQRLLTFEHEGGGFSWFGEQDPAPYLSVTAFGLMEFADMARVHTVDEAMIERTKAWLAAQQQSDGSWPGDVSEFFSFHTSLVRNTAFVIWSLASAGYTGAELDRGVAFVESELDVGAADPYTLAMVANALLAAGSKSSLLGDVIDALLAAQQSDERGTFWHEENTQTSFYGGGDDAKIATTALVAHALLLDGGEAATVEQALKFLAASKDALGNFGSTQATVWTLRTLLLAAKKGSSGAVGTLQVLVDDVLAGTVTLSQEQADVMTRVDLSTLATSGAHEVKLTFAGTGKPSYNLVSSHHLPWELVPAEPVGPLSLAIEYDRQSLGVDETVTATVTVQNNTTSTENMTLVTLGLPPGFEVLTEDLAAYVAAGQLSHFETTGKQVILYLTVIPAGATLTFQYRLRATMPVDTADGGGEVQRYYEPAVRSRVPAKRLLVE